MRRVSAVLSLMMCFSAAGAWAQTGTGCDASACIFDFTYNGQGTGNGIPGEVVSASYDGTLLASATTNQLGTQVTATTAIPIVFTGLHGDGSFTEITIILANATHDELEFTDHNATLNDKGRSGTANLVFGTGAFNGTSGNFSYTFSCTADLTLAGICYEGTGNPNPDTFSFSLTGSGTMQMYPAYAVDSLNTLFPTLPPGFIAKAAPSLLRVFGSPANADNPFGDRRPVKDGSSTGSETGSLSIGLPFQYESTAYTAGANCLNLTSNCWISLPGTSGTIAPFTNTSISAALNPGSLPAGVYPANITMTLTPSDPTIPGSTNVQPVVLVVNSTPVLQLSETAASFQAAAGSGNSLLKLIDVSGAAPLSYQASASTTSGGNWLSVTPGSGNVSASSSGTLEIQANPAGLAAGTYYGRVDVNSPNAATAWQPVEVLMNVAQAGAAPANFSPTGLIFVAEQGKNAGSKQIALSTLSNQPISITPEAEEDNVGTWLKATYSSTTLAIGQGITQTISVSTSGLAPGVYTGNVEETEANTIYPLPVALIVTPEGGSCSPTQLVAVFTNLYSGFEFAGGMPVSLEAQISDDCGNPLTSGIVEVNAPTGDATVAMTPTGSGGWAGTWYSHGIAGGAASITLQALSQAGLTGSASVTGTLDANSTATVVNPGGVVSAASPVLGAPLAPGAFISIYGSNLAPTNASSQTYPLATTLAGTEVLMNGQPIPLSFVSSGLINAVVPVEAAANTIQDVVVNNNGVYSLPEEVVIASTAPAIFMQAAYPQLGVIGVIHPNGTGYETSPTQTASAGDLLVVYCAGLGAVDPAIPDGAAAPLAPLSPTVNPVTATIGGVPAQVSFAGLAPTYGGVYQVNITVPAGITPGSNVPLVLTVNGMPSPPAGVAIQ